MAAAEKPFSATDLDAAEREFVESLDTVQEYLLLQARLQDQLKQGLMNLARAKYSMGPIGQAQYDMDMKASVRVVVRSGSEGGGGAVEGASTTCSGSRYGFEIQKQPPSATATVTAAAATATAAAATAAATARLSPQSPAAAVGKAGGRRNVMEKVAAADGVVQCKDMDLLDDLLDNDGDEDGGLSRDSEKEEEEEEELKEANEFLRRMRVLLSGNGGDDDGGVGDVGDSDGNCAGSGVAESKMTRRFRRDGRNGGGGGGPLHWFGVLVPPALKDAQSGFSAALETCLQLANTAQRMRPGAPVASSSAGAAEEGIVK
ncbi:hypothetical protein VaNZ11_016401 [Volvox africanus]|uniref:Vacuolar ATPase assembly protein VMA22 n=1 Tax=Volvox africanus TaxID=51714 RepID=A0ABQ5SNP3_9CHLO|nr:hypothetical protein VaNZ11_016401 [Volvox africanus]